MTYVIGALLIVVAIQAAAIVVLLIRETRRTHAERAVREREERFRLMVDRAPVMLWTARPDTTLDYLNSTCVEFTGLPIEKLRHLSAGDLRGLLSRVAERSPGSKVLLLSVHDEPTVAESALLAGADGVVLKRSLATDLLRAVGALRAGKRYLSPGLSR